VNELIEQGYDKGITININKVPGRLPSREVNTHNQSKGKSWVERCGTDLISTPRMMHCTNNRGFNTKQLLITSPGRNGIDEPG